MVLGNKWGKHMPWIVFSNTMNSLLRIYIPSLSSWIHIFISLSVKAQFHSHTTHGVHPLKVCGFMIFIWKVCTDPHLLPPEHFYLPREKPWARQCFSVFRILWANQLRRMDHLGSRFQRFLFIMARRVWQARVAHPMVARQIEILPPFTAFLLLFHPGSPAHWVLFYFHTWYSDKYTQLKAALREKKIYLTYNSRSLPILRKVKTGTLKAGSQSRLPCYSTQYHHRPRNSVYS